MNATVRLSTSFASRGNYQNAQRRSNYTESRGTYHPSSADFIASFYAVLNRWKSETAFLSDPEKITSHPSFKAISANIGEVFPLIIAELKLGPSLLVWSLEDYFNERPYPEEELGDISAMTEAWIAWADRNHGRPI